MMMTCGLSFYDYLIFFRPRHDDWWAREKDGERERERDEGVGRADEMDTQPQREGRGWINSEIRDTSADTGV
jgi:hypothetical protein